MNEDTFEGGIAGAIGGAEAKAGAALGDGKMQVEGETRQFQGKMKEALGTVHEAIDRAADKAKATASSINDQASQAYERVSGTAHQLSSKVTPFIEEEPYLAVALAAVGGLLAGLLLTARAPRVVVVKARN